MTQFVAAVKQRYTATGCNQPLYVFFHDIGDDYFFRYAASEHLPCLTH